MDRADQPKRLNHPVTITELGRIIRRLPKTYWRASSRGKAHEQRFARIWVAYLYDPDDESGSDFAPGWTVVDFNVFDHSSGDTLLDTRKAPRGDPGHFEIRAQRGHEKTYQNLEAVYADAFHVLGGKASVSMEVLGEHFARSREAKRDG
jgi:hypothetical protein